MSKMIDFNCGLVIALTKGEDGQSLQVSPVPDSGALPYRAFCVRHADYDAEYWERCRALYKGGRKLLGNESLMRRIMVQKGAEEDHIYAQRLREAFYYAYPSEIIDHIVAGLDSDPLRVKLDGEELTEEDAYHEFVEDVSRNDSDRRQPLGDFMRAVVREAEQVRVAWVRLDMPEAPDPDSEEAPASLAAQDEMGLRRVWAEVVEAEKIHHWQCDERGDLVWALMAEKWLEQEDFYSVPTVVRRWTRYDDATWKVWELRTKMGQEVNDDTLVPMLEEGTHTFKRVPFLRFELPEGLWGMDRLESIARSHLNSRNELDWAERRALLPILYEFLGSEVNTVEKPVSVHQQSPNRSVATPRSVSRVQRRGADDDAKWVGPDPGPFKEARDSCAEKRNEMHRVMYQMALAVDFSSAAALGRSADSKDRDHAAAIVVLGALGRLGREFVMLLMRVVAIGRGDASGMDDQPGDWGIDGWAKFDDVMVDKLVELMTELETLDIPSATAKIALLTKLLRRLLDDMSDEDFAKVRKELESAITQDQMGFDGELDQQRQKMELMQEMAPPAPENPPPGQPPPGAKPPAPPKGPPKPPGKAPPKPGK